MESPLREALSPVSHCKVLSVDYKKRAGGDQGVLHGMVTLGRLLQKILLYGMESVQLIPLLLHFCLVSHDMLCPLYCHLLQAVIKLGGTAATLGIGLGSQNDWDKLENR